MSMSPIPKVLHPIKFANQGLSFSGEIAIEQLPRIQDLAVSAEQNDVEESCSQAGQNGLRANRVVLALSFSRDEQNLRVITGTLHCDLRVKCQRCLSPVWQKIASDICLAVVFSDEQAKNLPKHYEPLLLENDEVNLYTLVEEEMLLSMPMFSYHSNQDCLKFGKNNPLPNADVGEATPSLENPFRVLQSLKKK